MRTMELVLAGVLALHLLLPLLAGRWVKAFNLLPVAAVLVMLAQILIEGYRWQMLPLYVLSLLLLTFSVLGWLRYPSADLAVERVKGYQAFFLVILLLAVILASALPAVFPIPNLPAPSGPYRVGTFSTMLVDSSRKELYSGNPDEARRIMVQFWYPAVPASGAQPGPWIENTNLVGPSISRYLGFPPFLLDHIIYARSHSYPNAALSDAQAKYPLIFFSHGWNGIRVQSTFLMEELASHGYIVVSIDHTYGARIVVFPDGRVAENNPSALPSSQPDEILFPAAHKLVDQWAGDIAFVMDTLTQWNQSDPSVFFTGHLDLDKVGASGHSTGGGAAIEFCGRDPRCKAGVGLDPYLTPVSDKVLDGGVRQPFVFLFSEKFPTARNTQLFSRLVAHSPQSQEISIRGSAHYDFTDLPLLTPLAPYLGLKGPINAQRVLGIERAFTLALFDKALRGGTGAILKGPSADYPELQFGLLP